MSVSLLISEESFVLMYCSGHYSGRYVGLWDSGRLK